MTNDLAHAALQPGGQNVDTLKDRLAVFQAPTTWRSIAQTAVSLGGFLVVCAAMHATAGISYWIALALAPIAAGLLVRTFIIQHDCGHGAFFCSRRWNDAVGFLCSLFTLAPYWSWRRQHAGHHAVWNNLDQRDRGVDIYSSCLTVDEFQSLSPWRRFTHRLIRHPIIANIILPPLVFIGLYRLPFDMPPSWRRERRGVHITNLALATVIGGLGLAVGSDRVLVVQLPVNVLASIIGVWLFTVQHRGPHVVWARQRDWNARRASLKGSNYLRLPPVLQWFTGNIGLHHVHHLNPRIPNYRLQPCHEAITEFRGVPAMTLGSAFKAMCYVLWDEKRQHMVTFRDA